MPQDAPVQVLPVEPVESPVGGSQRPGGEFVELGSLRLHRSHNLSYFKGIVFCATCGFYAQLSATFIRQPKKLSRRCLRLRTAASSGYVKNLERGRPPVPSKGFPIPPVGHVPIIIAPFVPSSVPGA